MTAAARLKLLERRLNELEALVRVLNIGIENLVLEHARLRRSLLPPGPPPNLPTEQRTRRRKDRQP